MGEEILVVKKERDKDKITFKVTERKNRQWVPSRYLKVIPNQDFNHLAQLFYDLHNQGYNIEKAFGRYKEFLNEPELFFL